MSWKADLPVESRSHSCPSATEVVHNLAESTPVSHHRTGRLAAHDCVANVIDASLALTRDFRIRRGVSRASMIVIGSELATTLAGGDDPGNGRSPPSFGLPFGRASEDSHMIHHQVLLIEQAGSFFQSGNRERHRAIISRPVVGRRNQSSQSFFSNRSGTYSSVT
jgi:hypothetical protein